VNKLNKIKKNHFIKKVNILKEIKYLYIKMVNYNCPRCGFETDHKSNMKVHIERKIQCKVNKLDINIKEYQDQILDRTFDKIQQLLFENNALKKEILELKNQLSPNIINNVEGHQYNNSVVININLTPYNDPNLDGAEKYYLGAIKKAFKSIPTIIENIHFNKEFPENHNICITNFRTKLAKVFNGKEWKTMNEDALINELVDTYEALLENWAEDDPDRMKYIENYNEIKKRDGESKVMKQIKDEVKKLIYDKRMMINTKI
jgi:hypothetical protein